MRRRPNSFDAAATVRADPSRYEAALREVIATIPADLGPAVRAAAIARAIDRLAFAAIEGGILRGGGDRVAPALAAGRFDPFLHPASVAALLRMARAGPPPADDAAASPGAAPDGRRFHSEDFHA